MYGNENLQKLIDHLRTKDGRDGPRFGMATFASFNESLVGDEFSGILGFSGILPVECGTSACALGFATECFPGSLRLSASASGIAGGFIRARLEAKTPSGWRPIGWNDEFICQLFGIDEEVADYLFGPSWNRTLFRQICAMEEFIAFGVVYGAEE